MGVRYGSRIISRERQGVTSLNLALRDLEWAMQPTEQGTEVSDIILGRTRIEVVHTLQGSDRRVTTFERSDGDWEDWHKLVARFRALQKSMKPT